MEFKRYFDGIHEVVVAAYKHLIKDTSSAPAPVGTLSEWLKNEGVTSVDVVVTVQSEGIEEESQSKSQDL